MKSVTIARAIEMVMAAFQSASSKHPVFASRYLSNGSLSGGKDSQEMLAEVQKTNDKDENSGGCSAESLLLEEMLEADIAYRDGHYMNCVKELSHCGAVVLRMMIMVLTQMSSGREKVN